jgi:hypothetical protein
MKEILQTLADRVSRKAILLMTAMILIYMIVVTPTVVHAIAAIIVISILSVIGVLLQFVIDCKRDPKKKAKVKDKEGKD